MTEKLCGIYTALVTPYDEAGHVNDNAIAQLVEYNLQKGVNGFYVCGSTGEAFMLTLEERKHVLDVVVASVANRAGVISHVGSARADDAFALARYAQEKRVTAVSSLPPIYYKYSFDEIVAYYADLAQAAQLPTIVYNFPANSGISLSANQLCTLLSVPGVAGLKHTSQDLFALERIKYRMPEKIVFNGYDEIFLSGLVAGADGAIGSTFNFMGEKFVKIRELYLAGKIDEARAVQHSANDAIEAIVPLGVLQAEKEILSQIGIACGPCRKPYLELTAAQKQSVSQIIKTLGVQSFKEKTQGGQS